ncbi:hypothetical protein RE6C_01984 [Rhodopirellula europaea 6C]|uniref:Uncharacterized protein n=1 Tax=Rhodopirellula europaea 6C TaxID=1263867 RepID=M2A7N1_9BACT|nr:hypothetical protein RE6C_01984 [Rhodopirellula europaea 6C]
MAATSGCYVTFADRQPPQTERSDTQPVSRHFSRNRSSSLSVLLPTSTQITSFDDPTDSGRMPLPQ